jgi:hypothetical protein
MQTKGKAKQNRKLRFNKQSIAVLALNAQQARLFVGGAGDPWDFRTTTSVKHCTTQNNTQTDVCGISF